MGTTTDVMILKEQGMWMRRLQEENISAEHPALHSERNKGTPVKGHREDLTEKNNY